MQENYFFDYLTAHPEIATQTKQNAVEFLRDMLRNGKQDVYTALTKDKIRYQAPTNRDLAIFAKDIYTILYATNHAKYPDFYKSEPQNMSAETCFYQSFCMNFSPFGFQVQNEPFDELTTENESKTAESDFIHFAPNGFPETTSSDVDNRRITKRIYLNISPINSLNVAREMAQYVADTNARLYCKFSTDNSRSDPFLFYTNEEQLPELMNFLDQLEQRHPEYLRPADCKMPFYANTRQYCGIADEHSYMHTSFNSNISGAFSKPLNEINKEMWQEMDLTKRTYTVENGTRELNAQNYAYYMAWLKVGQQIYQQKQRFVEPKTDTQKQLQEYYNELWIQYLDARQNPESQLAKEINEMGKGFYTSMQKDSPTTQIPQIQVYTKSNNPYNFNAKFYPDRFAQIKQSTGYEWNRLQINFNLHKELFDTLGCEEVLQKKLSLKNFDKNFAEDLKEFHISPEMLFMSTETAEKFCEYQKAELKGEIEHPCTTQEPSQAERK